MTGLRELVEACRLRTVAHCGAIECVRGQECYCLCSGCMAKEHTEDARKKLAAYLISTPDVLAAVEAIGALGEARAGQTAVRMNWRDGTEGHRERVAADQRAADARDDLFRLADRLAKGGV